jgi:phage FluMu protein Com
MCPCCGQKLCRAEEGSKLLMQCPKCKENLNLTVIEETVHIGKIKKPKHST